jgi:hypothetical protein
MKRSLFIVLFLPALMFGQFAKNGLLFSSHQKATLLNGTTQWWSKATTVGMDWGTTTDFSVAVWVKHPTDTLATNQRIIGKSFSPNSQWALVCITGATGAPFVYISDGTNSVQKSSSTAINDNKWHLLVALFDRDGNADLFMDGVSIVTPGSIAAVGDVTSANKFDIGVNNSAKAFKGFIGEAQVLSGLLTSQEIIDMYRSKKMKPHYSVAFQVAWYDWASGGTDKSGNGNHLTPTVNPPIIKIQP